MATVQLQLGNIKGRVDDAAPRLLIGRDPSCGMVGSDGSISRRHAEVYLEGSQLYIKDLGSSNGTWVDGAAVSGAPVALKPNQQVFVGHVPFSVEWIGGQGGANGGTMVGEVPAELKAMMEARRKAAMGGAPAPAPAHTAPAPQAFAAPAPAKSDSPVLSLGVGGKSTPTPAEYAYRRQGHNSNGSLLIALRGDTFSNNTTIDGYVEFTSLDNQTVASITIELVEVNRKGAKSGHVWDRMLIRQGPWQAKKSEVVPMPFQLRVPSGTSMSGKDVYWELRGYVDIDWAFDIAATSPINMRNSDIDRIRDALGALDYRIIDMNSQALGQRFDGKFHPPAQFASKWGISDINLHIEYLGTNMKFSMEVEKTSLFKFDKQKVVTFELSRLRTAPLTDLSTFFQQQIDEMMGKG
jgi:hypothetical protein